MILTDHNKLFWPATKSVGARSPGGTLYWQKCIQRMNDFVNNRNGSAPEVVSASSIFAKDILVRLKSKRLGPTIDLKVGGKSWLRHGPRKELRKVPLDPLRRGREEDMCPLEVEMATIGSSPAIKRAKACLLNFISIFLQLSDVNKYV